jgi:hypothetical protein
VTVTGIIYGIYQGEIKITYASGGVGVPSLFAIFHDFIKVQGELIIDLDYIEQHFIGFRYKARTANTPEKKEILEEKLDKFCKDNQKRREKIISN